MKHLSALWRWRRGALIFGSLTLAITVLTAMSMLSARPVAAEETLSINKMKVEIMPEYDEPRVLVISQGDFNGPTDFNKKVSFKLPKDADVTEVCGLKKPNDEHLCQLYETTKVDDGLIVTFNLPVRDFYFEFYYNPVQGAGERNIDFNFFGAYKIESLALEVQQPARSSDFKLQPEAQQVSDAQGGKHYTYSFQKVEPDKPIALKMSYSKQDANPSVPKVKQGTAPVSTGGPEMGTMGLVVGIVGVLGIAVVLMVRKRSPFAPEPAASYTYVANAGRGRATSRTTSPTPRASGPTPQVSGGTARFCPNCGASVGPGDSFCHSCGKKMRGKR
ncbi:MAG: zinc ribbon domain-containing protein [Chloroflexi bacterium]|nr:zinc ribbon domain-containing protein [Chloroflexota bacterium]